MEERPLNRISVIGRAGSGKTTFALRLGQVLGLPVTHLDAMYWTSDWKAVERELFEERQRQCVAGDRWVIDGGYLSSQGWPTRAAQSDVIVIAEAPILVCLWRLLHRALERQTHRPDRPAGAREQVSLYFLWWTASWGWRHRGLRRRLTAAGHRVLVARTEEDLAPLMLGIRPDNG